MRQPGMTVEVAEELFRQVAAFASFGFAKSHAAAFARTAYESAFLKLFYPAQFLVGLINAQPMGFYPVEVLVNDAKRHGVAVLPVDVNASTYKTTTEWVGPARTSHSPRAPGSTAARGRSRRRPSVVPCPRGAGTPAPRARRAGASGSACTSSRASASSTRSCSMRSGSAGRTRSLADVVARTGLPEEVIERLIRTGALDSLGRPRRELLWQLREVAGSSRGRVDGKALRALGRAGGKKSAAAGRPLDLRLPATEAPKLPAITEVERLGDAYAVVGLDARRQVVGLFREALVEARRGDELGSWRSGGRVGSGSAASW